MNNKHVIYLENNEIKAKSILEKDTFAAFMAELPKESILYYNGEVTTDQLTDEQKETFNLFFKSMKKNWDFTQILVKAKPSKYEVAEAGITLTVEDKPLQKKRGRKKKGE